MPIKLIIEPEILRRQVPILVYLDDPSLTAETRIYIVLVLLWGLANKLYIIS